MKLNDVIENKEVFYEEIVAAVKEDFERRREERRATERQWQLNLNYLKGDQYCEISAVGEIEESEKFYYWQNRNVYNHIAPVMDTRIARLTRIRPVMSVKAAGGDEADLKTASLTTSVLNSTWGRLDLKSIVYKATVWSEVCGTSFYKIGWDSSKGKAIGQLNGNEVHEGDIKVEVVSPFEIFPDCLSADGFEDCKSVIHAHAMHVDDIKRLYGVKVKGEDVSVFTLDGSDKKAENVAHDRAVVIEKYEMPSADYPCGRVIAITGDTLLYIGELPYINGEDGSRCFPFVMQRASSTAGCFFGTSIIERLIPIQRAYNAVKNRKEEFLNRVSMGVFAVEDGSVNVDELAEEGLYPGRVIVYRRGSNPPTVMGAGSVPTDFVIEEERLTNELILISGVSEFSRTSTVSSNISSGTALQLLIDQDETRLAVTGDNIRMAIKDMAKQIIRLFRQFATTSRIMRVAGENGQVEVVAFISSDISSDDVVFDTESEVAYTPAQKKNAVYELIGSGLLTDDDGKLTGRTKSKILEILGFGTMDNVRDIDRLHLIKAENENLTGFKEDVAVDEYDDHAVHIAEHTRFLLSAESAEVRANEKTKERMLAHLRAHKAASAAEAAAQTAENTAE